MRNITLEEYNAFPIVDGIKQCPAGNYSAITVFAQECNFAAQCRFAKQSNFALGCNFAEQCSFAAWCNFAAQCRFAKWGNFAQECSFAQECNFGETCSFGAACSFAEQCSFAAWCNFAAECSFADECSFGTQGQAKPGYPFLSFSGFGSGHRTTYFFNLQTGIYVRCGCYAGTLNQFRARVRETHQGNDFEKEYLALADLVEAKWKTPPQE